MEQSLGKLYYWHLLKNMHLIWHWRCYPHYLIRMVKRQFKWHKCASIVFRESTITDHIALPLFSPSPPCLIWTLLESLRVAKLSAPTHWAAITIHQFLFTCCSLVLACCKIESSPVASTSPNSSSGRQKNYQLSRTKAAPSLTVRSCSQSFLSLPSYKNKLGRFYNFLWGSSRIFMFWNKNLNLADAQHGYSGCIL